MRTPNITSIGYALIALVASSLACQPKTDSAAMPTPPIASQQPYTHTEHNVPRQDPYYWLRDDNRSKPEVLDYLHAENGYTKAVMAHTEALQETLFQEMKSRIKEQDESVPYRLNGFWYFTRYQTGKEYPIFCRRSDTENAPEQVILDANQRAEGQAYYSIGGLSVSPDTRYLAMAEDTLSRRLYDLRFKDLTNEMYQPEVIRGAGTDLAWADDNQTVFYIRREEGTLREFQVWSHRIGSDPKEDRLWYEEKDDTFHLSVSRSRSGKYIVITASSTQTDEVLLLPTDLSAEAFVPFFARRRDHKYSISHVGNRFFVLTNLDAPNYRLMEVAEGKQQDLQAWRERVPHRQDVFLEDIETFTQHLVIEERSAGLTQLRVMALDGTDEHFIQFDDPTYTAGIGNNPEQDATQLRYRYASLTTPQTTYSHDLTTQARELLKQTPVLGGFKPEDYQSERLWATARDGVKVPISLVYRKGFKREGSHPLYVYAYGSYGYSTEAGFSSNRLSLLDRGFVFAILHVRGGQELGRAWYESGKLLQKKNTFTDFIDATQFLLDQGYGNPDQVFAMGGSAGGLLMGAIANMAPELYTGIVAHVPFVDVVTTMLDETIPLTTFEYDEWGNPNDKTYFDYMLSYSPYDQVQAKAYPHLLVTAGLHDSQVQYWEPAKWVARLRNIKTDQNRLLLHMNMEAGHGGASGRFKRLRDTALEYAFILDLCRDAK
ncbi:MAG: S9 family peptidase [Bernardetiaceae bacterium]